MSLIARQAVVCNLTLLLRWQTNWWSDDLYQACIHNPSGPSQNWYFEYTIRMLDHICTLLKLKRAVYSNIIATTCSFHWCLSRFISMLRRLWSNFMNMLCGRVDTQWPWITKLLYNQFILESKRTFARHVTCNQIASRSQCSWDTAALKRTLTYRQTDVP